MTSGIQKKFIFLAGCSGALAVILGAMGAHALREKLSPEMLDVYNKAVLYHFIHTLALVALVPVYDHYRHKPFVFAGWCWIAGMMLFSGSLYLLSTRAVTGLEAGWLGPVTPFGGLFFIAGWILVAAGGLKIKV